MALGAFLDKADAAVGQVVRAGQEIARVGNSGRSPEPHLHIQMQNDWYLGAQSIPMKWSGLIAKRGDVNHYIANGLPQQGDLITDFFATNPISLESFFPFSVIGIMSLRFLRPSRSGSLLRYYAALISGHGD